MGTTKPKKTEMIGDMRLVSPPERDLRGRLISKAVGACPRCRSHVALRGFTNTCSGCGADFNGSGQILAPREQWGEETGESVADILMADVDPFNEREDGQ